ncbi:pyroglutamyl-peptidase I. Cysteine peptidase. MEROPS family C15 [Rhodoferax ferrireducens T118]|uniref:Pyrrolidone-carboxylate peptidase n=1 Tax=Albidiferax ferrireducens (strain ATCC BAA-621 / DSM 15236 / T118) TaxID=338969 RepID=Q220D4_ALBFT|nr:pyroglutamyl-peptidase I [Rhodoferax ferrireducens]ABD68619.1 pyroglutamyl-peptidase I. Cysteine peptidase. MEROPS family C15 [Rhodoferax ferrireducens T118]
MPAAAPLRILLTGFEPFERDPVNPSWEVARALDGSSCDGATLHAVQLPCVFGPAIERLDEALVQWQPQLVLALGLAGGRSEVSLERVAINVIDARIADNAGQQPIDAPVIHGAPAAYFSTLPIKAIMRDLRAAGLPGAVSNTAGTFVCNQVFYALMHRLASEPAWSQTRGGFIHLPYLPEQAARLPGAPSMALATQVQALQVAMRTALSVRVDVRESAGQLH